MSRNFSSLENSYNSDMWDLLNNETAEKSYLKASDEPSQ